MTDNAFTAPSLAVAFFASAGGQALLSAALDMRAALAILDEGNDDADASAAKQKFDDITDLLAEAGVRIVITRDESNLLRGDDRPEDQEPEPVLKTVLEPGDIAFAQASGYGIGPASETGDGREGFCYFAPDGHRSAAFTLQTTAWLAAVREVEALRYAVGENGSPPLARFHTEAEGAAYIDTLDPVKRDAGGYYLDDADAR